MQYIIKTHKIVFKHDYTTLENVNIQKWNVINITINIYVSTPLHSSVNALIVNALIANAKWLPWCIVLENINLFVDLFLYQQNKNND